MTKVTVTVTSTMNLTGTVMVARIITATVTVTQKRIVWKVGSGPANHGRAADAFEAVLTPSTYTTTGEILG